MANKDKKANSIIQPYIKVGNKQVQTTKEQARASMRAGWREQKVQEREQKCLTETGARCTKDCSKCDNDRQSIVGSLDAMQAAGYHPVAEFDLEELVAERILFAELAKELGELDPRSRQIMEMVGLGYSEREIAPEVGLSQKGVNKLKNKIFNLLREKLQGFR